MNADNPADASRTYPDLGALAEAEEQCTRCPLYRNATQAVPGEGPRRAHVMMVGEQPGDQEDIDGRPFVGPAGKILDRAIDEAGIDRGDVFVTNAVKHFKHEPRGKRRLHKRPNAYEIERCRWWLDLERELVKPKLVVALGATAAHSLFRKRVTISRMRGSVHALEDGTRAVVTTHPSAVLRMRDSADRHRQLTQIVEDLREARQALEE